MKFNHEREKQKVTKYADVEYWGVPDNVEGNTINALRYLPPKKILVGKQYKMKGIQVVHGDKALDVNWMNMEKKLN